MKLACLLVVLGTGCVIVPKDTRTVREIDRGTRETQGPVGELAVRLGSVDGAVNIAVARERTCVREHYVDLETKLGKTGELKAPDNLGNIGDPRGLAVLLVVAPVILAASGLITGIVVAASKDTTEVQRTVKRVERFDCTVRGAVTAKIELPSGATVELASDARGKSGFAIPETEPDVGVVRVSSGNATARVRYFRTTEACVAIRDRQFASANTLEQPGRRRVIEQLPACGRHTSKSLATTEKTWELTQKSVLAAIDNRCDDALANGWRVHQLDRPHHDAVLVTQPDVAACFRKIQARSQARTHRPYATPTVVPAIRGVADAERLRRVAQQVGDAERAARVVSVAGAYQDCLRERAAALRVAHAIEDVQARGRALSAVPVCRPE